MRNRIARLNSDGSLDSALLDALSGANQEVVSIAVAPEGKILIGGVFTEVNGMPADRIAALFAGAAIPAGLPVLSIGRLI